MTWVVERPRIAAVAAVAVLVVLVLAAMVGRSMADSAPAVPAATQAELERTERQLVAVRRDRGAATRALAKERARRVSWKRRAVRADRRIQVALAKKRKRAQRARGKQGRE